MTTAIYEIGAGGTKQCSMRDDGKWFIRYKGKLGWGRWVPMISQHRPTYAWYNPGAGHAKLPKDADENKDIATLTKF